MHGDMDILDPLIDDYLGRLAGSPDPVEAEMRRYADEREGYPIVGPVVGPFLAQLAQLASARRILEVGSGFGYSAFWWAQGLAPGGTVTLTDTSRALLERAQVFLGKAALLPRCRLETAGDGLTTLARSEPGLDAVFLDFDRQEYPRALALALPKLRPGGLLVAQGVLWGGAVARGETDPASNGLREFLRLIHGNGHLATSVIPLGDGLSVTLKR